MNGWLIRRGRDSDAEFLAWAILAATRSHLQRGWFDIALGRAEEFSLKFLQCLTTTKARSQWHYSGFWVAESDSRPVAAVSVVSSTETYPLASTAILESLKILGLSQADRKSFWQRSAYMFYCTTRPDDDSAVVEVVATLPEHRGCGGTRMLLSRALDGAKDRGFRKAEVACFIGNDAAQRVYEREGFRFVSERRNEIFMSVSGAPGILRFVKFL